MHLLYKTIYSPGVNWAIRNINYVLAPLLPSKIKIHPSGTMKVRVSGLPTFRLRTNQTSYITRELFWKKSEDYEFTPIFLELIPQVGSFFDVGASVGYYSILAAKANSKTKVYSFEPSKAAHGYLTKNVALNSVENNVTVFPVALSDHSGTIDFYEVQNKKYPGVPNLSGEHNIGTKNKLKTKTLQVQSDTLDRFVENHEIRNIDLIKLDTEGAETMILEKAINSIKKYQPIIICETLFGKNEAVLEKIMKNAGYHFYNHIGKKRLEKVESLVREKDNGVRNCFFVPPCKEYIVKRFCVV